MKNTIKKTVPLIILGTTLVVGCSSNEIKNENDSTITLNKGNYTYEPYPLPENVVELKEFIQANREDSEAIQNKAIELFGEATTSDGEPLGETAKITNTSFCWQLDDNRQLDLSPIRFPSDDETELYKLQIYHKEGYSRSTYYFLYNYVDSKIVKPMLNINTYSDVVNKIGLPTESIYDVLKDERTVCISNKKVRLRLVLKGNDIKFYMISDFSTANTLNFSDVYKDKDLTFEEMVNKYGENETNIVQIDYGYEGEYTEKLVLRVNVTQDDLKYESEFSRGLSADTVTNLVFTYVNGKIERVSTASLNVY